MKCKSVYLVFGVLIAPLLSIGQVNLILNPSFEAPPGLDGTGDPNGGQDDVWQQMPYWQPPELAGPGSVFGHVGTADFLDHSDGGTPVYRSYPYAVFTGAKEYIVGEVPNGLNVGNMYYFSLYGKGDVTNVVYDVYFSQNRAQQYSSSSVISFDNDDDIIHINPSVVSTNPGSSYELMTFTFQAGNNCDRITIGPDAVGAGGGSESAVVAYSLLVDDLKLLDLGPGGLCPEVRQIQNITYTDEVITYKASETIVAGADVGTYTTPGPVTVTGTSNITYRAGHEIQLLDGFGVEAGGTFHAFIAPCECDDPIANAGEPIELCDLVAASGVIQLGAAPEEGVSYQWSCFPEDGLEFLSSTTVANPYFTPNNQYQGAYTFSVVATNICQESASDEVLISYILTPDNTPVLDVDFNLSLNSLLVTLNLMPDPLAFEIVIQDWIDDGTVLSNEWTLYASQHFVGGESFSFVMPSIINGCDGHRIRVKLRNICSQEWIVEEHYYPRSADPLQITATTNVITPGGDGYNDLMCFNATGGYSYSVMVFDRFGLHVYSQENIITEMPVCTWDGSCNVGTCGTGLLEPGVYFVVILVSGCEMDPAGYTGYVELLPEQQGRIGNSNRESISRSSPTQFSNSDPLPSALNSLHPNPTTSLITYTSTEAVVAYQIMDLTGRSLHTKASNGTTTLSIDLSPYRPGTYLLRVQHPSGKVEVHRIIKQ